MFLYSCPIWIAQILPGADAKAIGKRDRAPAASARIARLAREGPRGISNAPRITPPYDTTSTAISSGRASSRPLQVARVKDMIAQTAIAVSERGHSGGDRLGAVDVRAMGVPETDEFDLDEPPII